MVRRPSIDPLGDQMHPCEAIMEGRHVDVIEMDAASHNGVGDIREITDAARYSPVIARFKVYLLDEVHMLSTSAFNALLKTLEEPPDACEVHLRHHRDRQGAGDGPLALPAVRSAPCGGAADDGASAKRGRRLRVRRTRGRCLVA
jgi:hypothetical protein